LSLNYKYKINSNFKMNKFHLIFLFWFYFKDSMGIGDWGLGIGDWGLGPIPNPQSPIEY
jgi:hypothetical protein